MTDQAHCSAAKARASAYPGALGELAEVLKLSQQKDKAGGDLIRKLTMPKKPTKANQSLRWTPLTAADDFARFYEYNKQDIVTEAHASARVPDLTPREHDVWKLDLRINMRGMQVDTAAVEDCIVIIEQAELRYNGELREITNGVVQKSTEVAKMLEWMRTQGVYLYELDEDTLADALKRTDYPRNVLRVLRIRQILAFGSCKKYYAFRSQTTAAGRLYDQYTYYGAHTSLWNGRGVQPANLYKGVFSKPEQAEHALAIIRCRSIELVEFEYGEGSAWALDPKNNGPLDALEVVASCLRSMIIAKPGHRLISADFTAIQAVATSCMANEQWRIDVFRTHGLIYLAMAALITGKTVEYYVQYRKQHGKHHDDRQLGKLAVLSADFGAWVNGWKRFGADDLLGDDDAIKAVVLKTRDAIPNIVKFWGGQTINKFKHDEQQLLFGLEGAAISAILQPGDCFNSNPSSRLGVLYQVHDDVLYCRPPSGGFIRYHAPRLTPSTRNYASPWEFEMSYEGNNSNATKGRIGWVRMSLYGGVQTQNVISHMCREIQADALLRLERGGYPVVMHTHDEGVAEVPNGFGSIAGYMECVRPLPAWAICEDGQPWPIKVPDAWEAQRYGKWED
jgi:DNA polymerase